MKRNMKKIKAHCGIGFCGAEYEEDFEFDNDATEDEIVSQRAFEKFKGVLDERSYEE